MLKTDLIILTVGSTGQTHMAMMDAPSDAACQDAAQTIQAILSKNDIPISAMRCGETGLRLTEFAHGYSEEEMRWHYRVTVKGTALEDGFAITQVAPGTCEMSGPDTYCTISAQHPVED
ncbi:hypothetical protein RA27_17710 [Ruegeria sp. ANG-R]|uniref:hypothetical protein n=1 Tax=Ruegeria sp. ANG-R TaxID=1577903 RepID=UPI00057D084D|nr:hypothetical protein [Ruegeria sp. ANG-R]KIC39002.1 hypothetical protein RA27_17710 [Ruegeria sp. ANG-R]